MSGQSKPEQVSTVSPQPGGFLCLQGIKSRSSQRSGILLSNHKIGLRMLGDGAAPGGLRADDRVSAVALLPDGEAALPERGLRLHICPQCALPLLAGLPDGCNAAVLLDLRRERWDCPVRREHGQKVANAALRETSRCDPAH